MVPAKLVAWFDQTVTAPPLPAASASAWMAEAASIATVLAVVRPGTVAPWLPPPICTLPPPAPPLALIIAPASAMLAPPMVTLPPMPVGDETSSVPATCVVPPSTSAVPSICALVAATPSAICTAPRSAPTTAAAGITARMPACAPPPPPAGSANWRKPSPVKSSVVASPASSAILPIGTVIVPLLRTLPPSNAAKPPLPTVTDPAFEATPVPLPWKASLPAMKSPSAMSSVDATKPPPTSTEPLAVIAMPLGLTR